MDRRKKEGYKGALIAFALASLVLYLGLSVPYVLAAAPFILVYLVARAELSIGGVAAALSFGAAAYFDLNAALAMAAAFLPVAFAAGYMIRAKKRFRDSVIVSVGAVFLGAALVIGMSYLAGQAPIDRITGWAQGSLSTMSDGNVSMLYQAVRYLDVMTGAITQQALLATPASEAAADMLKMLHDVLSIWLVTLIGLYSLLFGLLCFVIPRAAAKRSMEVAAAPAFADYTLPKRFWLAYVASYLFAAAGESFGWKSFDIIGLTVYNLYAFVFTVQALSFFDFMYKKRGMGAGTRALLHVLAAIVLSFVLVWVGIFENIFGIRKRMEETPQKNI